MLSSPKLSAQALSAFARTAYTAHRTEVASLPVRVAHDVDSVQIRFSGTPRMVSSAVLPRFGSSQQSAFSTEDIRYIRDLMDEGRYGLAWNWLDPSFDFVIEKDESGNLVFPRYYSTGTPMESRLTGNCAELSLKMIRRLQEKMGDRFEFLVAPGNITGSKWVNHYFILAWPVEKAETFIRKVSWSPTLTPVLSWVIDPTYKHVGQVGVDTFYYNLDVNPAEDKILAVPTMTLPPESRSSFKDNRETGKEPLGWVHELDPAWDNPEPGIALFGIRVEPDTGRYNVFLEVDTFSDPNAPESVGPNRVFRNWQERVTPGSSLARVLSLIQAKLDLIPAAESVSSDSDMDRLG